jgi:hypothetical protein
MRRACAALGADLQNLGHEREALVVMGGALVNLAGMLNRTLRRLTDDAPMGPGHSPDLERALLAYRQLHTTLRWYQEHQYGALSFELRQHLSDAQRRAHLALDALHDWEQMQRPGGTPAAAFQVARV